MMKTIISLTLAFAIYGFASATGVLAVERIEARALEQELANALQHHQAEIARIEAAWGESR